jgi:hypothetical protein
MGFPVTAHFDVEEFACRSGDPYPVSEHDADTGDGRTWLETRLRPLCETLEMIRASAGGGTLTIDSGYRTLAYDDRLYRAHVAAVGDDGDVAPASRSQHPQGRAADITHVRLSPLALFRLILSLYEAGRLPHLGGVGLYPSFVHVDVRPRAGSKGGAFDGHLAIWGGSRPSNIA